MHIEATAIHQLLISLPPSTTPHKQAAMPVLRGFSARPAPRLRVRLSVRAIVIRLLRPTGRPVTRRQAGEGRAARRSMEGRRTAAWFGRRARMGRAGERGRAGPPGASTGHRAAGPIPRKGTRQPAAAPAVAQRAVAARAAGAARGPRGRRSWLAGTLWPDSSEEQAPSSLRRSLTDLRRAVGPEAGRLGSPTPHRLCLESARTTVDVAAFRAALARGDRA